MSRIKPLSQIQKENLTKLQPYVVCALASFFYIYEFLLRVTPSAMPHELMHAFHIDAVGFGFLGSLFFWGYAPMQMPVGILYDRYSPRILLTASVFICAIATILFGYTEHFAIAGAMRFLMGFTGAFAYVGALVVAARWFDSKYMSFFAGIIQTFGCIGAIVGQSPIAGLSSWLGWRDTIYAVAILGLLFSLLIWIFVRDYPKDFSKIRIAKRQNIASEFKIGSIIKKSQNWVTAAIAFCSWSPITVFASLWGVPFLMEQFHIDTTHATSLLTFVWIAIAIGAPVVGGWSNRIQSRRIPLMTCSVLGLIGSIGLIYFGQLSVHLLIVFLLLFGFSAAGMTVTFGIITDINEKHVIGTAVGFNNMAIIAGGIVLQPIVGVILRHYWKGGTDGAIPHYSTQAYHMALLIIPACYIVGFLCTAFLLKESGKLRSSQA